LVTIDHVSPDASSRAHAPNTPALVTVTVNVHVLVLPALSATVHVTVVVPSVKVDPEAGTHIGTPTPGQLSETVGGG
jgi:hypothetical protein